MPRDVKLPSINLAPEEIVGHLFRNDKSLAESWKIRYSKIQSSSASKTDERLVATPCGKEERDS